MSGAWERLHEHVNFHPNFPSSNSLCIGNQARIYKQYGFVHYTVPEEAEAAINGMNNRIIAAWQNDVMPTCKMPLSPVTQWHLLELLHLGFTKDRDYQLTVKYANSSEKAQIPWQRDALQNELSTARSKLNLSGWEKRDEAKRSEVYRVICWSQQRLLQITLLNFLSPLFWIQKVMILWPASSGRMLRFQTICQGRSSFHGSSWCARCNGCMAWWRGNAIDCSAHQWIATRSSHLNFLENL